MRVEPQFIGAIGSQPMQAVPNHPYVQYRAGRDANGQWWIQCVCSACGDSWQKPCFYPERTNSWVYRYALQHGHGLRPVQR